MKEEMFSHLYKKSLLNAHPHTSEVCHVNDCSTVTIAEANEVCTSNFLTHYNCISIALFVDNSDDLESFLCEVSDYFKHAASFVLVQSCLLNSALVTLLFKRTFSLGWILSFIKKFPKKFGCRLVF